LTGAGVAHTVVTPAALGPMTLPALSAANLANLMVQDRPLIELVKK
jgi:hypothetical protein